jgi:RNA binding exosome subunit
MFEQNEVSGEVKIKNSGFTNKVVAKANNPVILSNFMDVWSGHVNDMSMYHSFVLPLEDFNRVFNYNSPKKENQPPVSVKGTIQNAYSPAAVNYVKNLITDLNGGARTDSTTGIINKMMGLFKKGSVFASLSVVVQQPSAIARAAALVDTKYFIGPKVDHKRHAALWNEVKQYAPVAIIKEMGYFDTNMGKSTQDFILGKEYSGFSEKMKALVTDSGYRDEVLSKAPALADEIAWCSIWEAVKREMHAKYPGLDVKSEPFLMLCGSRFTEVITKTQVYDSVLSRSANMRSKDTGMKMATSFMAEPTTSINMVADALLKGKRGNKKYARSAIGAVIASQICNSILVSFVYAGRDDDEDETYWEKYIGTLTGEILDSLNPAGYIPFIKDIMSIVQGYDVERSDMAVISDLWTAVENLKKDNVSVYRKVEGFAGSIAQIFGLPVKNIMRDARGIYQTVMSFVNGQQTTKAGIGYAVKGAITGETATDKQQLYEAYRNGDQAHIARVEGRFKDQSAINTAIRKALRENDPRIKQAAEAKVNGDLDEYLRIAKQIIGENHFKQDDVVAAINAEINAMSKDDTSSGTAKASGMFKAEDFATAIAQGDQAMANAIKTDIIQTAQKNGKTAEEAEKSFNSSAKSGLKELFLAGEVSEQSVINALTTHCGVDEGTAKADVMYWTFKSDYPDVYADDSWFDKYYEDVADSGIEIDMYMEYRNQVKDITGEGKKERRMYIINSLPITSAQKDALYYAEGWAASKLYEAPWH